MPRQLYDTDKTEKLQTSKLMGILYFRKASEETIIMKEKLTKLDDK